MDKMRDVTNQREQYLRVGDRPTGGLLLAVGALQAIGAWQGA